MRDEVWNPKVHGGFGKMRPQDRIGFIIDVARGLRYEDIYCLECHYQTANCICPGGNYQERYRDEMLEEYARTGNLRELRKSGESKWISIEDRLPHKDGAYLVHAVLTDSEHPFIAVAWFYPDSVM